MNLLKISVLTTPNTTNVERRFSVLNTLLSTKLQNTLLPNSLGNLNAINFNGTSYDLDRSAITDLDKFLKKQHKVVLCECNLTIHV